MILTKLQIRNIRSYQEQEIIFPEGSVLLAGDVGSGKTTLLLAIEYALFGLQPGQKGAALLRNDAKDGSVILECIIDSQTLIIERTLRRDTKGVANEYAALTLRGEKKEYSLTELKTKILSLLGYPEEFVKKNNVLYKYTVYTPQEHMKQIILEDAETRLSILRHMFGINKYKRIKENIDRCTAHLKDEVKTLTLELKIAESDKRLFEAKKKEQSTLREMIKEEAGQLQERTALRKQKEREKKELEEKQGERNTFMKEIEKTNLLITTKKQLLEAMQKESRNLEKTIASGEAFSTKEYEQIINEMTQKRMLFEELQNKIIGYKVELSTLETQKRQATERKEKVFSIEMCPTCLQDVPARHKHIILNDTEAIIVTLTKKAKELEEQRRGFEEQAKKEQLLLQKLEEGKSRLEVIRSRELFITQAQAKFTETQKAIIMLQKDIAFLLQHSTHLKEAVLSFSKFNTLVRQKEDELKRALQEERAVDIHLAQSKKEFDLIEKELTRLLLVLEEQAKKEQQASNYTQLLDWLTTSFTHLIENVERQMLLSIRKEFVQHLTAWFYNIAGEGLALELDETFTPIVLHKGIEMEYSFLSGGERTALALAYRLALTAVINSRMSDIKTKEIIILDEPTDGFSEYQIDKMREIMRQLPYKQLILVSHEQKMEGFVDHVLRVTKESDCSRVSSETQKEEPQTLNMQTTLAL